MDPQKFIAFVNHWTPENLRHEPLNAKMARAMLNMAACIEAQRTVSAGLAPIRNLSSFPKETYPLGGPF